MSSSGPGPVNRFAPATDNPTTGSTTQPTLGQLGQYDLLLKLGEGGMEIGRAHV